MALIVSTTPFEPDQSAAHAARLLDQRCLSTVANVTYCANATDGLNAAIGYLNARSTDPRDVICSPPKWIYNDKGLPVGVTVYKQRHGYSATCKNPDFFATRYFSAGTCSAGETWNNTAKKCEVDCKARPSAIIGFTPPNGSLVCQG